MKTKGKRSVIIWRNERTSGEIPAYPSFEVGRELSEETPGIIRLPISNPRQIALLWRNQINPLKDDPAENIEAMVVIYLDASNRLIDWTVLGVGVFGVTFDPRVIVAEGRKLGAKAFALVHNHPPGISCSPSQEDLDHVRNLKETVDSFDFRFHDSIIVNLHGWKSICYDRFEEWRDSPAYQFSDVERRSRLSKKRG